MTKYLLLIILFLQAACFIEERAKFLPIDKTELKYKKGECIGFKVDSINYGVAIVMDYSKDEGGLWYGLVFTDYLKDSIPDSFDVSEQKIFGRKVRSSYHKEGFFKGLDLEYIKDSCFIENMDKFVSIGILEIDSTKIAFGAQGASGDYGEMIQAFRFGLERRFKSPEDYRDFRSLRTDEYFNLREYIKN